MLTTHNWPDKITSMSVREQLQREAAVLPEGVVQRLLDYLHSLPASETTPGASSVRSDYFDAYWRRWYGRCEGQVWDEPSELPLETREAW